MAIQLTPNNTFATDRAAFVGQPVQDIKNLNEQMYQNYQTNLANQDLLEDTINNLEVLDIDKKHVSDALTKAKDQVKSIRESGKWYHAGTNVKQAARDFANDKGVKLSLQSKANVTAANTWLNEAKTEADRGFISAQMADTNAKYRGIKIDEEGNASSPWTMNKPVDRIDIAAKTDAFLKDWKADTTIGGITAFKDTDGTIKYAKSSSLTKKGNGYLSNKTTEYVSADELRSSVKRQLMSDPNISAQVNEESMLNNRLRYAVKDDGGKYILDDNGKINIRPISSDDLNSHGIPTSDDGFIMTTDSKGNEVKSDINISMFNNDELYVKLVTADANSRINNIIEPYVNKYAYQKESEKLLRDWQAELALKDHYAKKKEDRAAKAKTEAEQGIPVVTAVPTVTTPKEVDKYKSTKDVHAKIETYSKNINESILALNNFAPASVKSPITYENPTIKAILDNGSLDPEKQAQHIAKAIQAGGGEFDPNSPDITSGDITRLASNLKARRLEEHTRNKVMHAESFNNRAYANADAKLQQSLTKIQDEPFVFSAHPRAASSSVKMHKPITTDEFDMVVNAIAEYEKATGEKVTDISDLFTTSSSPNNMATGSTIDNYYEGIDNKAINNGIAPDIAESIKQLLFRQNYMTHGEVKSLPAEYINKMLVDRADGKFESKVDIKEANTNALLKDINRPKAYSQYFTDQYSGDAKHDARVMKGFGDQLLRGDMSKLQVKLADGSLDGVFNFDDINDLSKAETEIATLQQDLDNNAVKLSSVFDTVDNVTSTRYSKDGEVSYSTKPITSSEQVSDLVTSGHIGLNAKGEFALNVGDEWWIITNMDQINPALNNEVINFNPAQREWATVMENVAKNGFSTDTTGISEIIDVPALDANGAYTGDISATFYIHNTKNGMVLSEDANRPIPITQGNITYTGAIAEEAVRNIIYSKYGTQVPAATELKSASIVEQDIQNN